MQARRTPGRRLSGAASLPSTRLSRWAGTPLARAHAALGICCSRLIHISRRMRSQRAAGQPTQLQRAGLGPRGTRASCAPPLVPDHAAPAAVRPCRSLCPCLEWDSEWGGARGRRTATTCMLLPAFRKHPECRGHQPLRPSSPPAYHPSPPTTPLTPTNSGISTYAAAPRTRRPTWSTP